MATVSGFIAMEPPTVTHNDLVIRRGRGGARFIGKSDRLRDAEDALVPRLAPLAPERPLTGPLKLTVRWCFRPRGGHADGEPHAVKPDSSNMLKTLEDCMVRAGVIEDDRLVCWHELQKAWSDPAGIYVRVEEVGGPAADREGGTGDGGE